MRSSRSVNSFASVQSYTDRWRKRASSGQSGKSSSDSPAGSITSGSIHIIGSTSGQRSRQRRRISSRKQAFNARITSQMSLSRLEELYNVRPGFKPINVFRKAARLVVILVKAGGCFGNKKVMMVGTDDPVCYDTPEARAVDGAASFNPKYYQADRNLKLGRDIIKMLGMHPNERKPEMIEKIMRAIQLVLETFADYPLDTQKAISKYAYFESFSSGRVVMRKNDRPLRFHIIITGRALLADMMRLPTGKEEIRWRGVISKGENFGDESEEYRSSIQIYIQILAFSTIMALFTKARTSCRGRQQLYQTALTCWHWTLRTIWQFFTLVV